MREERRTAQGKECCVDGEQCEENHRVDSLFYVLFEKCATIGATQKARKKRSRNGTGDGTDAQLANGQ